MFKKHKKDNPWILSEQPSLKMLILKKSWFVEQKHHIPEDVSHQCLVPGVQDKMYQDTLVINKTRIFSGLWWGAASMSNSPTPHDQLQPSHTITGVLAVLKPNQHNLT